MPRKILFISMMLIGIMFVGVGTFALVSAVKPKMYVPSRANVSDNVQPGFVLTLKDGEVVIKKLSSGDVCEYLDTPVQILSKYDADMLASGLYFDTLEDARRAAADFCG